MLVVTQFSGLTTLTRVPGFGAAREREQEQCSTTKPVHKASASRTTSSEPRRHAPLRYLASTLVSGNFTPTHLGRSVSSATRRISSGSRWRAGHACNGIYRGGDLVDANRNGWSGAIGDFANCDGPVRFGLFWYDTTSDQSGTHNTSYVGNIGGSANDLKTPTKRTDEPYCQFANGHCADSGLVDPPWNFGMNQQQNTLRGVLDANSQPF